jgi:hypothetical protein
MKNIKSIDTTVLNSLSEKLGDILIALQNQQSFETKWLPSIVGILSLIVALIVAWMPSLSAKHQIKSAKDIADKQLDSNKEIITLQLKAALISQSRKEWIENLRQSIAEVVSISNKIHKNVIVIKTLKENPLSEVSDDFDMIWKKATYIELLLNQQETEHLELIRKQLEFVSLCGKGESDIEKFSKAKSEYIDAAKRILKAEWEKAKNFS